MKIPIKLNGNLTTTQIETILSLVSIAENSSIDWYKQYGYCENINDGRGYTIGLVGFCTGTGDYIQVLEELQKLDPGHRLIKYIPLIKKQINNLELLENLPKDCKLSENDTTYQLAQWTLIAKLYWNPVIDFTTKKGFKLPITIGELYDHNLNSGNLNLAYKIQGKTEIEWLKEFLDGRKILITKEDKTLDSGQPDRVLMWRKILDTNNVNLDLPINNIVCYGEKFNISNTNIPIPPNIPLPPVPKPNTITIKVGDLKMKLNIDYTTGNITGKLI